jgi:hypothetical protein
MKEVDRVIDMAVSYIGRIRLPLSPQTRKTGDRPVQQRVSGFRLNYFPIRRWLGRSRCQRRAEAPAQSPERLRSRSPNVA